MARSYIPAAGHDLLLPLYDPLQRLVGGDRAREELVLAAAIEPGHCVLDIGCGTGSLVAELARRHPDAKIFGIDPDPKALARAARKAARAEAAVQLDEGYGDALPYGADEFDRVLSTFMFHHLPAEEKLGMLTEAQRVLRPGGELHLLDFSRAADHSDGFLARHLHGDHGLHDNTSSRIAEMMATAGFVGAREASHRKSVFGRIGRFEASAPTQH